MLELIITMPALAKLQHEGWQVFMSSHSVDISLEMWQKKMSSKSPTFLYWGLVMEFEIATIILICAHHMIC